MTDALTVGWTRAQAATARIAYRRLLGFTLIVQTVIGLIAIIVPVWLARQADLPGYVEPVQVRWPNIVGIVARFVLAVAYVHLGRGLRWFALYELMFAVALAWSYRRLLRAELMSRP